MSSPFTIITTIDLRYRPLNIILRMVNFFNYLHYHNIPCVVGYSVNGSFLDKISYSIFNRYDNIKIANCLSKNNISNSILRNAAIDIADTDKLILSDIDIYPNIILYNELYQQSISGFSMAPVLYLSSLGTKKFLSTHDTPDAISWWKNFQQNKIMHLAIPSSLVCISRNDSLHIGGFDEKFYGHGYEDFDFLIRLCSYLKILDPLRTNFFIDQTYHAPILSQGFRRELAHFALKNCLTGHIGIHLYHKKAHNYKSSREINKKYFANKFHSIYHFSQNITYDYNYDLIAYFYKLCKELHLNPSSFSSLFTGKILYN